MSLDSHKYFSENSELYATARPAYPEELFKFLALESPDLHYAWDCGTGSGQAALSLANYFDRVEATDVSREQIGNAVPHEKIHYSIQTVESTDFPDNAFSLVTAATSLHWFDFESFWPEVHRVLKPNGIFAAWAYSWFLISEEIDRIIEDKLLKVIEDYWMPQNRIAWEGYKNIRFPFAEISAPAMRLEPRWTVDQLLAFVSTWSATRRCVERHGEAFFEELTAALAGTWGTQEMRRTVSMEIFLRVGRHET